MLFEGGNCKKISIFFFLCMGGDALRFSTSTRSSCILFWPKTLAFGSWVQMLPLFMRNYIIVWMRDYIALDFILVLHGASLFLCRQVVYSSLCTCLTRGFAGNSWFCGVFLLFSVFLSLDNIWISVKKVILTRYFDLTKEIMLED